MRFRSIFAFAVSVLFFLACGTTSKEEGKFIREKRTESIAMAEPPVVIPTRPASGEKNLENTGSEDRTDSTTPNNLSPAERKKKILGDLSSILKHSEESLNRFTRNLKEEELIYFYYIILGNSKRVEVIQQLLKNEVYFNSNKITLTDAYVKIQKDSTDYIATYYISYPKTVMENGAFYKPENDTQYFTSRSSIPVEASRGGMNAEFVQYDYVKEYWFTKNYPIDLAPFVEVIKKVASDVDYDFEKAYGIKARLHPGKKGAVCDDYADITTQYLSRAKIPGLTKIYKISSETMNHAWNEVVYNGKIVFIDSTWFDINKLDDKGFSINLPKDLNMDFDYHYITYDRNLFNKGFSGKKYSHYLGNDAKRQLVFGEK